MTDAHRVTRSNRRRFLFGSAGGTASYTLGLSPTLSQPLQSTARILVGFPPGGPTKLLGSQIASCISRSAPSFRTSGRGRCERAGNDRRATQPVAARFADHCRGGRRSHSPNGSAFFSGPDPNGTVETLSSALRAALQTKEVQAGLANQSVDAGGLTPADFARQVKIDFDRAGPIVKASGFTPLD